MFWKLCVVSVLVIQFPLYLQAENWFRFLGPNGNNQPAFTDLPTDWSEDNNVKWKVSVPGTGWACPIVWENKVFISTAVRLENTSRNPQDDAHSLELHCLDLNTGDTLWKQTCYKGKPTIGKHLSNTYATETPVTDGKQVVVYYGMMGVYCYDMDGNKLWDKDLGVYAMQRDWGTSSSPIMYDGKTILQIDNEENSFLIALDTKTGDEIWRIKRNELSNYSTPVIWENSHRTELVVQGQTSRSYNPENGEVYWQLNMSGGRNDSSPLMNGDLIYMGTEARPQDRRDKGGGYLYAVKAGASGDISPTAGEQTSDGLAWIKPDAGVAMASPLPYQGLVFVNDRRMSVLTCYNAKTGETVYSRTRMPRGARPVWSTPWGYNGNVFCLDEEGTTFVVKASENFEVVDTNKLDDKFWCSPAFANGKIIFRGVNNIYCISN